MKGNKPMNSVGKWKLATYILAATTAIALYRGRAPAASSASEPVVRDAAYSERISALGRLRIPASVAGLDEEQLLRDLAVTRSHSEVQRICDTLAVVGTDRSLDALEELSYTRREFLGATLKAMGGIGTDQATDRLINMVGSDVSQRSYWAIQALGATQNHRAQAQLIEWAKKGRQRIKLHAIAALGQMGSEEEALETLRFVAEQSADSFVLNAVVQAAGLMGTVESVRFLQEVAERSSREVRITAIDSYPGAISDEQQEWLMNMLASGDQQTAAAAARALGRSGAKDALPLLEDIAKSGGQNARLAAISAMASLGGEGAVSSLAEMMAQGNQNVAYECASALLNSGGAAGRQAFMRVMREGHSTRANLLYLLADLEGEDAEALSIEIARTGTPNERAAILPHLSIDNEEVLDLMLELTEKGPRNSIYNIIAPLARSSSPKARKALFDLARRGGQGSDEALRVLGQRMGTDPEAEQVIMDAFYSGAPSMRQAAGWALAGAGTESARETLLAALKSDDVTLATNALNAISGSGSGVEMREALREIARSSTSPELRNNALYQMMNSGDPDVAELVKKAVEEKQPGAEGVLSSLVMQDGPGSAELIDLALRSESPAMRSSIANSLTGKADDKSLSTLEELSRDEDANVRSSALYAMASTGGSRSMERVLDVARNGELEDRAAALSALGSSGDPEATPVLVDALRSGESSLIQSALYSVYNAGPEVDEALRELAEDTDVEEYMRQQAVSTLITRGAEVDEALKKEMGVGGATYGFGLGGHGPYW